MASYRALTVAPDGTLTDGPMTNDQLRAAIGGWLQTIDGERWIAWLHEEGKLQNLRPNPIATVLAATLGWSYLPGDFLVGPVIFTGVADSDGECTDVPDMVCQIARAIRQKAASTANGAQQP